MWIIACQEKGLEISVYTECGHTFCSECVAQLQAGVLHMSTTLCSCLACVFWYMYTHAHTLYFRRWIVPLIARSIDRCIPYTPNPKPTPTLPNLFLLKESSPPRPKAPTTAAEWLRLGLGPSAKFPGDRALDLVVWGHII